MNEIRRKKVMKVMVVVLLVFGGSLIYFLFFNSGLEVLPDPSDQSGRVIIANRSVHTIREISVSYVVQGQKIPISTIPELRPNNEFPIPLDSKFVDEGKFVIHASAPYHLSRQLAIQAQSNTTPRISFSFEFPSIATQHNSVSVEVSGCNQDDLGIILQASLEMSSVSEGVNPPTKSWGLPPNECGSTQLVFTPLVASETLSFKIKVSSPSLMLVERTFMIEVLPSAADQNIMDSNVVDGNVSDSNGVFL